jgi:hypothetical protein
MSQQLFIHEFSTGITPEGSKEKWVSKGFTGRYMNMTMKEIPTAVERAIANNGFAVAEGASSDQPAIIGRAIPDSDQPSGWAVVALVTRGEDEYGRSFGFHRYFLCQGSDRLWMLVDWIEAYRSQNGQYPIFNPYKLRETGKPAVWQEPVPHPPVRGDMLPPAYEAIPCLMPAQSPITLVQINQLAQFKAETQQGQTSWAYNVEALEQPSRFLVIKPASVKAEQILRQPVLASTRTVSASIDIDEQAIKGAIKGLINSAQVNADLVEVLISNIPVVEDALKTEAEVTKYWEQLFDGQGAANGISQNIMTSQMVRLLAIRSIVLPERLPQYLAWLKIEKADQVSSSMQDSMRFQQQIRQVLSTWRSSKPDLHEILEENVFEGVKASLLDLYRSNRSQDKKKGVSIEPMVWLLRGRDGLWGSLTSVVADSMGERLQQIYEGPHQKSVTKTRQPRRIDGTVEDTNASGSIPTSETSSVSKPQPLIPPDKSKGWQEIWNYITQYRNFSGSSLRSLSAVADVFSVLGYQPLAACFYQISLGEVPTPVYKLNQRFFHHGSPKPYGLPIKRQLTRLEVFIETVQPYFLASAGICAVVLTIIGFSTSQKNKSANPGPSASDPPYNTSPPVTSLKQCEGINQKIDDGIKELTNPSPPNNSSRLVSAMEKFESTTRATIEKIVKPAQTPENYQKIANVLLQAIGGQDGQVQFKCENPILNINAIEPTSFTSPVKDGDIERWIAAIYLYQKAKAEAKGLSDADSIIYTDGIISSPDKGIGAELSKDYSNLIQEQNGSSQKTKPSQNLKPTPKPSTKPPEEKKS